MNLWIKVKFIIHRIKYQNMVLPEGVKTDKLTGSLEHSLQCEDQESLKNI